jgi:hypothetical protein
MIVKADYATEDEFLRFDLYSLINLDGQIHVDQMLKDLSLLSAAIMAGIEEDDFIVSVSNTGWVGTRPEWNGYLPIVTLPRGSILALDQLGFMLESLHQG